MTNRRSTTSRPVPAQSATSLTASATIGGARKQQENLRATLELLAERSYDGLTIEGVAERAGTNKTTIYRWWPSKPALLSAALLESRVLSLDIPNTGSLRRDLEAIVKSMITMLTKRPAADIALAALGAAVHSTEMAQAATFFFADRLAREQPMFERAKRRGELPAHVDPLLVMDLLGGALWLRLAFRKLPLEKRFAANVVAAVLDGVAKPRQRPHGRRAKQ